MLEALGGLALLVRGLALLSTSLGAAMGGPARRVLTWATAHWGRAWLAGVLVGALTLNSTALSLTAMGLAELGIAGFTTALVLGLSAKAGATLALLLAATPLGALALPILGVGFALALLRRFRTWGEGLSGLGMLLLGLSLMTQGFLPLVHSELFSLLREGLEGTWFWPWSLGFVLAALLGSANAVAALALALTASSALSLPTALLLTLGGGAGSGMVLAVAGWNRSPLTLRVALAHLGWKVLFSLPFVFFLPGFSELSQKLARLVGLGPEGAVAQGHLLYHLLASFWVLPLLHPIDRLMRRLLPDNERQISPRYLSADALDSRELASSLALREVGRIGDQILEMLGEAVKILGQGNGNPAEVARREEKVDQLARSIVLYLSELSARHPGNAPLALMTAASEIEHMGDQVRRILRKQERLYAQNLEFSREGRGELCEAAKRLLERLRVCLTALATGNTTLAVQVTAGREGMQRFLLELRRSHLERLEQGRTESRATTLAHLDLLIVLDELDQSVTRLAQLSQELHGQEL